jgi:hypothetical protein
MGCCIMPRVVTRGRCERKILKEGKMREAMAITGYVSDALAQALASGKAAGGAIEVKPERGYDDVVAG